MNFNDPQRDLVQEDPSQEEKDIPDVKHRGPGENCSERCHVPLNYESDWNDIGPLLFGRRESLLTQSPEGKSGRGN